MKEVNLKVVLILVFQLAVIIVLVGFSTNYVKKIASHSENSIHDNLRTVRYCAAMEQSIHVLYKNINELSARIEFENNLKAQTENITEKGEKEATATLQEDYFLWLRIPEDSTYNQILENLHLINGMNVDAMERKNEELQNVAGTTNRTLILIDFFGALVAFVFTFAYIGQLFRRKNNIP